MRGNPCLRELRRAEVPFVVALDDALMEGEIDLLCTHGAEPGGTALAIDYKTGGSDAETPAQLNGKHLLQAQCYAYALLSQGFDEAELRSVRVERPERPREGGYRVRGRSWRTPGCVVPLRPTRPRELCEGHVAEGP
ncbi:MAG: PD-(D/E)XK nuclease family protein [Gordonibacter pamelaeae]